jgi:phospholipase/lecithinase/hemolysin
MRTGGRKILLVTLPDISMSPGVKLQPAMYQDYAAKYSTDYRTSIFNLARKWEKLIDVEVADTYKAVNKIFDKPGKYGFNASLIATPCYPGSPDVFDAPVCDSPDTHFFWDSSHPTTATLRILVSEIEKAFEKLKGR